MKRSQIKKRPLTDTVIASLEPEDKPYSEKDSKGLYLHVKPSGAKSWLMRYKDKSGKWCWHGLGAYPHITGAMARKLLQDKIQELASGADKLSRNVKNNDTLADVIDIWVNEPKFKRLAKNSQDRYLSTINAHILPKMGAKVMADIDRDMWLKFFREMQNKQHHVTKKTTKTEAIRAWRLVSRIYTFAMNEGIAGVKANPVVGLDERLEKVESVEMAHVAEEDLPKLLKAILTIKSPETRIGLLLLANLFLRPSEVLNAKWSEIDFDNKTWDIPAERMKKRRPHIVPLSDQVARLLQELHEKTGQGETLFTTTAKTPKSARAKFYVILRRLGFNGKQTLHGFRHIASTKLNNYTGEDGFKFDERVIEFALAHKVGGVKGVYNKAQYFKDRQKLNQWYSDWLESLQA